MVVCAVDAVLLPYALFMADSTGHLAWQLTVCVGTISEEDLCGMVG